MDRFCIWHMKCGAHNDMAPYIFSKEKRMRSHKICYKKKILQKKFKFLGAKIREHHYPEKDRLQFVI